MIARGQEKIKIENQWRMVQREQLSSRAHFAGFQPEMISDVEIDSPYTQRSQHKTSSNTLRYLLVLVLIAFIILFGTPQSKQQLFEAKSYQRQDDSSTSLNDKPLPAKIAQQLCKKQEYFFHEYNQEERSLYYRTYYQHFFFSCKEEGKYRVGRVDMENWSQEREAIEWGRNNINANDTLLYDCPNCRNFEEIMMLSRFLGSSGQLLLFNQDRCQCLDKVIRVHNLNNIRFIGRRKTVYQKYPIVISKNVQFFKEEIDRGLLNSFPKKLLIKLTDSVSSSQALEKMVGNDKIVINKVLLTMTNCKDNLQLQQADTSDNFYQIIKKSCKQSPSFPANEPIIQIPWLIHLNQQYEQYKKKLPSPSERKNITTVLQKLPVQLNRITSGNEEEKKVWMDEKQLILWAQNRTSKNWTVYYQHNTLSTNIFVVLNIASLLPQGKLLLRCNPSSRNKIEKEADNFGIKNIEFVENPSNKEFSANAILTDSLQTIKTVAQGSKFDSQLLVGHFTEDQESKDLIYSLNVHCQIQKVTIISSFYYGFQIFDHFFWNSENPTGFFQVKKSKYITFGIWNQKLGDLTPNRKYSISQMIRVNSGEIKIINPVVRPYFFLPQHPMHKSFQFLCAMHKSDYIRNYLMYNYGGGYADIKHYHYDMLPHFKKLQNSPDGIYGTGYPQPQSYDVACAEEPGQPSCATLRQNYRKIMGANNYIWKKHSPIMKIWFDRLIEILDENYQKLKKNPAKSNWQTAGTYINVNGEQVLTSYPIILNQLDDQLFSRAQFSHLGEYYLDLPTPILDDYR